MEKVIDFYSKSIDNVLIFGDFSMETTHPVMTDFLENHNLYSMINIPTCFKSVKGRCIDLMLTNNKHSFFGSQTFETGFSDFHHLIYTMLKTTYVKHPPKKINFRDCKKFSEPNFRIDLARNLSNSKHENLGDFEETFAKTLQKHAPYKSVLVRGNNKPHVTKDLRKTMMKRTRLKTIANRTRTDRDIKNYESLRNLVVKMNRQAKKEFYANLDPAKTGNSKKFWKTFKPIFTKGGVNTNEKIVLAEDGHILHDDKTIGECFNSYFVNITDTLNLPEETISTHGDVTHEDPMLQAIK